MVKRVSIPSARCPPLRSVLTIRRNARDARPLVQVHQHEEAAVGERRERARRARELQDLRLTANVVNPGRSLVGSTIAYSRSVTATGLPAMCGDGRAAVARTGAAVAAATSTATTSGV